MCLSRSVRGFPICSLKRRSQAWFSDAWTTRLEFSRPREKGQRLRELLSIAKLCTRPTRRAHRLLTLPTLHTAIKIVCTGDKLAACIPTASRLITAATEIFPRDSREYTDGESVWGTPTLSKEKKIRFHAA